ncbi:hypothetical protein WR25_13649 [Diploscapter pachys]|uniref:PDZ domain-containing protein n=1 Tax=Diploscapter pachys TaxID=2018661 RepID=A0A2A2KRE7_9BILA|nr:hypothetical protein WR25_13649 [Diploscapter pachys]
MVNLSLPLENYCPAKDAMNRSVLIDSTSFLVALRLLEDVMAEWDEREENSAANESYMFKRTENDVPQRITYVDYVQNNSSADKATLRKGDVVLAVNGVSVTSYSHSSLVNLISSLLTMRLVTIFRDVPRIISLSVRSMKLNLLLEEKVKELRELESRERDMLDHRPIVQKIADGYVDEVSPSLIPQTLGFHHVIQVDDDEEGPNIDSTYTTRL